MSGAALWRALPPVGDAIRLRRSGAEVSAWSAPRQAVYLQSGTAALALLLIAVARRARAKGTTGSDVLLPAYGCPDIVSAVAHAGLRAKLVDLAPESPFPSAQSWRAAIDHNTVALVTVGFLGMRDPFAPKHAYAAGLTPGAAIEDCCQVHPMATLDGHGHSLAVSFGRGKPVSLMHGGAALVSDELAEWLPAVAAAGDEWAAFARLALTTKLYNVLRSPWSYGWITRLPGLGVGDTHYDPLRAIEPMNARVLACLDVGAGWNDSRRFELQRRMRDAFATLSPRVLTADLSLAHGGDRDWLLRYPLLLDSRSRRDAACVKLNAGGLGASPMYGRPLAAFDGIGPALGESAPTPCAAQFADRLLTLPLHADVRAADVDAIREVLRDLEAT